MEPCPNCGTPLAKNLVERIKDPEQLERCHTLPPVEASQVAKMTDRDKAVLALTMDSSAEDILAALGA